MISDDHGHNGDHTGRESGKARKRDPEKVLKMIIKICLLSSAVFRALFVCLLRSWVSNLPNKFSTCSSLVAMFLFGFGHGMFEFIHSSQLIAAPKAI